MLSIKEARKSLGGHCLFNQISLDIQSDCIVGLAGPSGSGKSTLLRCIQGLDTLDAGQILVSGKTAFMFQDFQLFPHMTLLENVCYAPRLHDPQTDPTERAHSLLSSVGLAQKAQALPHQCSGGQKQRAALCRCLMINPSLLLCDEPTSGLDVASITEIVDLLKSLRRLGVSMILASHDLDFLTQIADRLILLNHGQIMIDCDPKDLHHPVSDLKQYYL